MKVWQFPDAQKAFIRKQRADGIPVAGHLQGGWDRPSVLNNHSLIAVTPFRTSTDVHAN